LRFEGILKIDLQGNRAPTAKSRQIRLLERAGHSAHSMASEFFTDDGLGFDPSAKETLIELPIG